MDRQSLRESTHNAKDQLVIGNPDYEKCLRDHTVSALAEDLAPDGIDITTTSIFDGKDGDGKSIAKAKSNLIVAGIEELRHFLAGMGMDLKSNFSDGQQAKLGDIIFEISDKLHGLLAIERTVLNLVIRMSSVATHTRKVVDMVKDYDVLVTSTRKTLWGLLDKKAVTVGGGGTHRLNLSDAILVKDTHLDPLNRDFEEVFSRIAKSDPKCRFVEVEVLTKEEAIKACEAFKKSGIKIPGVIMFDNMTPEQIAEAIIELKKQNLYDDFLFEASGGITEENIKLYAGTGIDIVSLGALTVSPPSVDISISTLSA